MQKSCAARLTQLCRSLRQRQHPSTTKMVVGNCSSPATAILARSRGQHARGSASHTAWSRPPGSLGRLGYPAHADLIAIRAPRRVGALPNHWAQQRNASESGRTVARPRWMPGGTKLSGMRYRTPAHVRRPRPVTAMRELRCSRTVRRARTVFPAPCTRVFGLFSGPVATVRERSVDLRGICLLLLILDDMDRACPNIL